MSFSRTLALAAVSLAVSAAPFVAMAQTAPYSQLVITTQVAAGMSASVGSPIVTITATNPTTYGVLSTNNGQISYATTFSGDIHTVNFIPGSYSVSASGSNYYFSYSSDCTGFTPTNGAVKYCTVTLSTTPPPPVYTCSTPWYGGIGCAIPVVPYNGSTYQTPLSCSPSYQTVGAGQSATFTAQGGTPGGYNWSTTDRTFLNAGAQLTTIFQSSGTQTVIVSNGVQSATCTVNVGASNIAVTYVGAAASVIGNYIPAYLPNTGFGPQNGAVFAFAIVLLLGAGVFFFPYVRKALVATLG